MPASCEFGGCDDPPMHPRRHVPTGTVYHYCYDHAPDIDTETWEAAND